MPRQVKSSEDELFALCDEIQAIDGKVTAARLREAEGRHGQAVGRARLARAEAPARRAMTRLALLRHADTAWSREGRIQGRIDVPVLENVSISLPDACRGLRAAQQLLALLVHDEAVRGAALLRAPAVRAPAAHRRDLLSRAAPPTAARRRSSRP